MKVLVYTREDDEFMCPKCGEKIKLNTERIDDIISSINNLISLYVVLIYNS